MIKEAGNNWIIWLSNLSKEDVKLAGGKGANLGEMFNTIMGRFGDRMHRGN